MQQVTYEVEATGESFPHTAYFAGLSSLQGTPLCAVWHSTGHGQVDWLEMQRKAQHQPCYPRLDPSYAGQQVTVCFGPDIPVPEQQWHAVHEDQHARGEHFLAVTMIPPCQDWRGGQDRRIGRMVAFEVTLNHLRNIQASKGAWVLGCNGPPIVHQLRKESSLLPCSVVHLYRQCKKGAYHPPMQFKPDLKARTMRLNCIACYPAELAEGKRMPKGSLRCWVR